MVITTHGGVNPKAVASQVPIEEQRFFGVYFLENLERRWNRPVKLNCGYGVGEAIAYQAIAELRDKSQSFQ